MKPAIVAFAVVLMFAGVETHADEPSPEPRPEAAQPAKQEEPAAGALPWLDDLERGQRRAATRRRPVLLRVGAAWCPACKALGAEIEKPDVQKELARWTLVYLDVSNSDDAIRGLGIMAVPALRIRSPTGRTVASHNGGFSADALAAWLARHYEAAGGKADESLLGNGPPDALGVVRLVEQLSQREPTLREAAIRQLATHADLTRDAVVQAMIEGSLATRLGALEVLRQWKAPVGGLDPWQPETLTEARIGGLQKWTAGPVKVAADAPGKLSEERAADARRQIARLLEADEAGAAAIRERLARLGEALMPEVYARLKEATTDRQRERLLALRYRLVAADSLVLRWPGGLDRLAATDIRQRQQAAEELVGRAAYGDGPLLLELFGDPDPLVREIALRGLQEAGGPQATGALVKLLDDPEPNVRAAVLKQLAESPSAAMVPKVAAYIEKETDADLVVHGIRFLRQAGGPAALEALMAKLDHPSWQVRAEAAEAIGKADLDRSGRSIEFGANEKLQNLQVDAYVALIRLLEDTDAFVVSRAVTALEDADMEVAVEPLAKAAQQHPDLAPEIIHMLAQGSNMRLKALPHLRKFTQHAEAKLRAAAIAGLVEAAAGSMDEEIAAGLSDSASEVRTMAAWAVFRLLQLHREKAEQALARQAEMVTHSEPLRSEEPRRTLSSKIVGALLGGLGVEKPKEKPAALPEGDPFEEPTEKPAVDATAAGEKPGADTEKNSAETEVADQESGGYWEEWLAGCYAGENRPKWTGRMIEPLRKMLSAEKEEERLTAALALVPLGESKAAVPVLLEVAAEQELVEKSAEVLPWLLWDQRQEVFHRLRQAPGGKASLRDLVNQMAEVHDRRAGEVFWQLLAEGEVTEETAGVLAEGLQMAYFGERYYSMSRVLPADRRALIEAAQPRATTGGELERLVALVLLARAAPDEAAELAVKLVDDKQLGAELRSDLFQIILNTQPKSEGIASAIAALAAKDKSKQKLAIHYLAFGPENYTQLRGHVLLYVENAAVFSQTRRSGLPIIPEAPAGLKPEHVRPLLTGSDPEVAAYAGYLLALLREPAGLDPLLKFWRGQESGQDSLDRLVYRAIATLDDAGHAAVLREIYSRTEEYHMQEFYWTIRIMSGPEVLKLRKQIRDEVGMSNLR